LLRDFGAENLLDYVSACSAEDVAYAIIRGAALRQRSVYYPYFRARVVLAVYQFVPWILEKTAAVLFARN